MITTQLESAIEDIDALVALTKFDIEDIKEAQHDKLSDRLQEKESLISSFEHKKTLLIVHYLKAFFSVQKRRSNSPFHAIYH